MLNSSKQMMKYQFDLNKKLADENRNWQERMANSAHQREIADLKAAGLNPVLSVTGGSGATTPSGSTASVSDGAGYASALANLQAAQINSATQMYMHTTPSGNSLVGQIEWLSKQLGLPISEVLGVAGDAMGFDGSPNSTFQRINNSDLLTLGPKADSYNSALSLKSLRSSDVYDYLVGYKRRFVSHSKDYSNGKISKFDYNYRSKKDKAVFNILSTLYPEEYKKAYGSYPYKGLKNNRRLQHAKR